MKFSILIRLVIGVGIAAFIFASALRASLEDILAPLPVAGVASISDASVKPVESMSFNKSSSAVSTAPVSRRTQVAENAISTDDLHGAILHEVERTLRPAGELSLVPLRDLPNLSTYSQPFSISLTNVPNRLTSGNVLVGFQVENGDGLLGEWSIPFRVALYSEVWVPRGPLQRGDIASSSDFVSRSVNVLVESDAVPATLENLLRREYSRNIKPGQPVTWADLVERSLVRKGEVVEVSAVNGLLAITMRAVARQDGADGDLILLRNIDSAKEFSAKVVGESRVEVAF